MTIQEEVDRLAKLIARIKIIENAEKTAAAATSSYARVNISANSSNYDNLHEILTLAELTDIMNYIHDKIHEKKVGLENELNAHIISKKI